MKKTLYTCILLLGLVSMAKAQCPSTPLTTDLECEKGKGIVTDPNSPVNCEGAAQGTPILWRLNDFDWRIPNPQVQQVQYYDIFEDGYFGNNTPKTSSVINPFTGPTDAEYTPWVTSGIGSDYQPEDGWELIKVEFGSPKGSAEEYFPKLPYMMLYNKYSATLRFFGALMEPNTDLRFNY